MLNELYVPDEYRDWTAAPESLGLQTEAKASELLENVNLLQQTAEEDGFDLEASEKSIRVAKKLLVGIGAITAVGAGIMMTGDHNPEDKVFLANLSIPGIAAGIGACVSIVRDQLKKNKEKLSH